MSLKIWLPLNGNIENQGTLNTTSRLPSGYTEVEYLESTGAQYIDTGVDNNTNSIKLYTTIQVTVPASVNAYALGHYTNNQGQFFLYRFGTVWQWAWRCSYLNSTGVFDTNKHSHIFYVENNIAYYKLDGQIVSQCSADRTGGRIYIAGNKHNQSTVRTFTAAIDDGNTVKRNFVPCYRNSDNKPGMYDTVTGTFYTNAGSGEFSVGPAVTCSITNNGATVDNNGKIGKCYSFDGSSNYVQLTNSIIEGKKPFTFSVWYKTISGNSYYPIISVGTSFKGFTIHGEVNRLEGGDGTNHFDSSNYIVASSVGTWAHLAVTYDGTKIQSYLNGTPDANSLSWTYGFGTGSTTIKIGHFWGGYFKGCINDFRLYDECLSAEEIKEISRGMVLHYKMCQPERSENLLANGAATEITCRSQNQDYPLKAIRTTLENNTQYTLSFDAKSDNGLGTFYCSLANDGSSQIYCATQIKPTIKYKHYVYTVTHGTQSVNNILFAAYYGWSGNANVTDTIRIKNVKLEKGSNSSATFSPPPTETLNWGTIEYDGSGYKNHGTVSGNVTLSADSPRYTGSYTFNGNDTSILIGDLSKLTPDGNFTMSCWIKKSEFSSKGYDTIFGGPSGFELESKNDTANERKFCAHNWGGGKWDYEFNKWYHLVMVRTSSDTKFYFSPESGFNNTPVITGDPGSIPSGNYYVGSWRSATEQNYKGLISDFRIYSTALDATDVAELYKLGK